MEGSIGEHIKAWVFGIIGLGLVAFFIWPIFEQMRGEVTVYNMFCKTQRIQGQCKADEEQTANPQSFKVYPDQQSVIYWIGDSAPTKYSNCAVRDTINWRCTQGRSGEARMEYSMVDATYGETLDFPFIPSTATFYQVPRWRWWWLKMVETVFGKH
jgi:hypothetical protein